MTTYRARLKKRFWQSRLGWKLMASYLIVIVVGVLTLSIAAESVVPTTFDRHLREMQQMMEQTGMMGMNRIETDLFSNYQAAFTETLMLAALAAGVSAVIVSYLVARRVVTPVRHLMEASRRIAGGHYRERVPVAGDDELGQLALSFNQMAAALDQTEVMRRELIANVTHELRTPLTSIKGYMEGLLDGVLPTEAATFQQVYREADRLQRLVNDLQELSRVEADAFELHTRPLAIDPLIQQVADHLRPQFKDKGVALTLELAPNLLPVLALETNDPDQPLVEVSFTANVRKN